jgi:serine/threonine protein kinase
VLRSKELVDEVACPSSRARRCATASPARSSSLSPTPSASRALALDHAHRKGIGHRDIKPENILLHDGSALVADFGIALAASKAGETRMTQTGMSLGTPHYMSPEQAMGVRGMTARSDVYALGCVLYCAAGGRLEG